MQHEPTTVEPTSAPTTRDIRLDLISMNEWRVCDRRYPERDSRCVLGFIERHDFRYEVTSIRPTATTATFGSLASATASFSEASFSD